VSDEKTVVEVDQGTAEYRKRILEAKGTTVPVGGAPMPKMPRFDQPPRDAHAGVQAAGAAAKILSPEQRAQLEEKGQFIPGVGSAYAANQPKTAPPPPADPEWKNPPRPPGAGLSEETVRGLEELGKAKEAEKAAPVEEDRGPRFDAEEFGDVTRSLLNNKKRREAIEARLVDQITIEDLITLGELRQRVPIVPGRFEPTFRSVSGSEDIWVKHRMGSESGSDQYIADKYAMMNLTLGLYAINGKELPGHMKDDEVDPKLFEVKFKRILKFPLQMLADMSVNFVWFIRRVEKTLVIDDIKGF
jgi:hypothetical protein